MLRIYIIVIIFQLIFVFSILGYKDMMAGGTYVYPDWSINMGWLMTASSISCIPAYFIYKVYKTPGPFMQVCYLYIRSYKLFAQLKTKKLIYPHEQMG